MNGSGTIWVQKRDGGVEDFDSLKLVGAVSRAVRPAGGRCGYARPIAAAIELFCRRSGCACVSSAAVFEMTVKAMRCVRLETGAEAMESHRTWRARRRRQLRVSHEGGQVTMWDKSWLCELAQRSWRLSRSAARIIAGRLECELLAGPDELLWRGAVVDMLNAHVAACGLADAVPAHQ